MKRAVLFPNEPDRPERPWRRPLPPFQQAFIDREYAEMKEKNAELRKSSEYTQREFDRRRSQKPDIPAKHA